MFRNLNPSALGISGHQSEIIELVLTYGFKGMDLPIEDFANRVKRREMPYARRLIDSAKITLGSFVLPIEWDVDDEPFKADLEKLPEYARMAAEVGCTRCVARVDPAGDKRPYHENFEFHRHRFADIAKALQPAGVWLGIGFRAAEDLRKEQAFQFIHDLEALMLLMNMVGEPNVGVLLDLWDLHVSGGTLDSIQNIPVEQILAVEVADVPAEVPLAELTEKSRLLAGSASTIELPATLHALAQMGYDGPITPTPYRGLFEKRRRDMIVKEVGNALDEAWKAAELTPSKVAETEAPAEAATEAPTEA